MSGSYVLILNSSVATNQTDNTNGLIGPSDSTYYVDWITILGDNKDRKFKVECSFKTVTSDSVLNLTSQVKVYIGSGDNYDQTQSQYSTITFAGPKTLYSTTANAPLYYNESNYNSNNPITINYPDQDYLRVTIRQVNGTEPTNCLHYMLRLRFTPISE